MQSEMMVVDALQISGLHVRLEFLTLPHLLSTNTKTNIEYFERRLASVSGSNVWSTLLHITTHYYTLIIRNSAPKLREWSWATFPVICTLI